MNVLEIDLEDAVDGIRPLAQVAALRVVGTAGLAVTVRLHPTYSIVNSSERSCINNGD
jgi:hypothetical protein